MAGACVSILASRWWQAAKPSGKYEAVDYNWLMEFKKNYSASKPVEQQSFISLSLEEETPKKVTWEVKSLQLQSPDGDSIEIKSNNLFAVSELLRKLS